MIVTKEKLESLSPCVDGFKYWLKVNEEDLGKFMVQAWKDDHSDWAHWLFVRVVPRKLVLKYALHSAESVLDIFEREYAHDNRPRNAIEAVKTVIENDTPENRRHAYSAASYAANAAYYADAAAEAADAASYAANAAYYADAAAEAADAVGADRKKSVEKQIIEYGIKVLNDYKGKE